MQVNLLAKTYMWRARKDITKKFPILHIEVYDEKYEFVFAIKNIYKGHVHAMRKDYSLKSSVR
jgi:hypothetical protein